MQDAAAAPAPVVQLRAIACEGTPLRDLEREALTRVLHAAAEGLSDLAGSDSSKAHWLLAVQAGAASLLVEYGSLPLPFG